uniref:Neur_chan_memb domain-containing protein n=1 Tax=Ascaris lumbricoides TaxID=6252 RepID=A0A0M3HKY2_ASCLU
MLENFVYMDTRVLRNYYPPVVEEVRSPLIKEELSVSENVSKVGYGFKRAERLKFDVNDEVKSIIVFVFFARLLAVIMGLLVVITNLPRR